MDLISRETLIDDLCADREEGTFCFTNSQAEAADEIIMYVAKRIKAQPTVDAVPLDKLCEWLANIAVPAPCYYVENYCPYEDFGHCDGDGPSSVKDCWKMVLSKWMEGLDAAG